MPCCPITKKEMVGNERSDIQVCWKERRNGIFDEASVWFSTVS